MERNGTVPIYELSLRRREPGLWVDLTRSTSYRYLTMESAIENLAKADRPITGQGPMDAGGAGVDDEELAKLAHAIAHPARVRIVRLLDAKNTCVCGELVEALPLAQSTVSQHLKVLKRAGLIQGEIDGPRVCYCLVPGALKRLRMLVATL